LESSQFSLLSIIQHKPNPYKHKHILALLTFPVDRSAKMIITKIFTYWTIKYI